MIATIAKVAEFDQFMATFSTIGVEKRKEHGCKGAYVFRDPDDPDRVWVFFDWDIEDYQRFLSDPRDPGHRAATRPLRATGEDRPLRAVRRLTHPTQQPGGCDRCPMKRSPNRERDRRMTECLKGGEAQIPTAPSPEGVKVSTTGWFLVVVASAHYSTGVDIRFFSTRRRHVFPAPSPGRARRQTIPP